MRSFRVSIVSALTSLVLAGCGISSERMPVDEASEAQRLVFGAPQAVRTQFASQISTCWFSDPGPLSADYSFTMPEGVSEAEPLLIRVFENAAEREEVFQVQFYQHNENTIVATRNISLSAAMADELDRSVEFWLLDPAECRLNSDFVTVETGEEETPSAADAQVLQLPPLVDEQASQGEADSDDEDMHRAELRARGAIEE